MTLKIVAAIIENHFLLLLFLVFDFWQGYLCEHIYQWPHQTINIDVLLNSILNKNSSARNCHQFERDDMTKADSPFENPELFRNSQFDYVFGHITNTFVLHHCLFLFFLLLFFLPNIDIHSNWRRWHGAGRICAAGVGNMQGGCDEHQGELQRSILGCHSCPRLSQARVYANGRWIEFGRVEHKFAG